MQERACQVKFASYIKNHLGSFTRSYDQHWSMHYMINGECSLQIGDEHHEMRGSWFWAGFPGPLFIQLPTQLPQGHYRAALTGDYLEELLADGLWPQQPLRINDTKRMNICFENLLKELKGSTPLHNRRRVHAIEACLLEAWSQQEQAPQQELWLERCCQRLQDLACEEINYHQLASELFIPLSTLRRRFRQAMGMPMHRYALEHRCHLAQELLLATDDNLDLVADQLGYDDVAYFSRQFKKIVGMNPSAFRQQRYY